MALVNGMNYDHIDLQAAPGGNTIRHMLQDTKGRALVAPAEDVAAASAAHPKGSYFTLSGALYRATADIASGGTIITSGTGQNCEAVTVGGELAVLDENKAPVIVDDASGAKASFSDAVAGLPLVSCLAQIDANLAGKTGCTVIRSATQNAQDGTAFSIAFGRTVYGGTVDFSTGTLTVTWKSIILNGTEYWGKENTAPEHWRFNVYLENAKVLPTYDTQGSVISDVYASSSPAGTYDGTSGISLNGAGHILLLCDETYETVDALKAALAASNVQAVYQLETPEAYQLTPVEITALAGQNYIWADAGDTTVQYRIDTKAYINKKFAPLGSEVSELKNAFEVLEPIATSGDVGKALIAKTVENGKVTEYEFGEAGGGISSDVKSALLACFAKVAWIDEDGQDYYDALEAALYGGTRPITNTLSHCVTSNTEDSITKGAAYSATISASSGYTLNGATVSITMGGVDITSSAYNNGTISIASVTGALAITVTAIAVRESLFGTFEEGHSIGTNSGYAGKMIASSRACSSVPFLNDGYTFAVTDSTKYQINAVDVTSNETVEVPAIYGFIGNIAYPKGAKSVAWNTVDSVTTSYCWLALKKIDGTAFTAEELADGAAAVFTYTSN